MEIVSDNTTRPFENPACCHPCVCQALTPLNLPDCKNPAELAIIKSEGSLMGPLLLAVNAIAKKLAPKFPHIAVDTLACASTGC